MEPRETKSIFSARIGAIALGCALAPLALILIGALIERDRIELNELTEALDRHSLANRPERSIAPKLIPSMDELGAPEMEPRAAQNAPIAEAASLRAESRERADAKGSARGMIQTGAYERALEKLADIARSKSRSWEIALLESYALLGLGRLEEAQERARAGLAIESSQARLWLQLGLIEAARADHLKAMRHFDEARQLDPTDAQVWLNIGYSSEALGDYVGAARSYRAFLKLSSDRVGYIPLRAATLDRLEKIDSILSAR